jgi:hypothetical protein
VGNLCGQSPGKRAEYFSDALFVILLTGKQFRQAPLLRDGIAKIIDQIKLGAYDRLTHRIRRFVQRLEHGEFSSFDRVIFKPPDHGLDRFLGQHVSDDDAVETLFKDRLQRVGVIVHLAGIGQHKVKKRLGTIGAKAHEFSGLSLEGKKAGTAGAQRWKADTSTLHW